MHQPVNKRATNARKQATMARSEATDAREWAAKGFLSCKGTPKPSEAGVEDPSVPSSERPGEGSGGGAAATYGDYG